MSLEIMVAGLGDIKVEYSEYTRIVSGSGTLEPPAGAKAMRVAVIGGGAAGSNERGGGGGGCAATRIVKAEAITYSIGAGGVSSGDIDGSDTTATFGIYALVGGGATGATRGSSSGGDYNYLGGNGNRSGGGGAGPGGDAASGVASISSEGATGHFQDGWGVPGGNSGATSYLSNTNYGYIYAYAGGGGAGAAGGSASAGTDRRGESSGSSLWGRSGGMSICYETRKTAGDGGEMGGGGGAAKDRYAWAHGNGGSGGMVVEWFF